MISFSSKLSWIQPILAVTKVTAICHLWVAQTSGSFFSQWTGSLHRKHQHTTSGTYWQTQERIQKWDQSQRMPCFFLELVSLGLKLVASGYNNKRKFSNNSNNVVQLNILLWSTTSTKNGKKEKKNPNLTHPNQLTLCMPRKIKLPAMKRFGFKLLPILREEVELAALEITSILTKQQGLIL